MSCCNCEGVEEIFGIEKASKDLASYKEKGPSKTTRILIDAVQNQGIKGMTVLDIGGGIGAIEYELLKLGVSHATNVDASDACIKLSEKEAKLQEVKDKMTHYCGDFVDLEQKISSADIVTLDKVICCYKDMESLVTSSARHTNKIYGLIYPRDTWWVKIYITWLNLVFWFKKTHFRTYVHSTKAVEGILKKHNLKKNFEQTSGIWQISIFSKAKV